MNSTSKPILYHARTNGAATDFIRPRATVTTLYRGLDPNSPEAAEHSGEMTLATASLPMAYAYSLKLMDRTCMVKPVQFEGAERPYEYLKFVQDFKSPEGESFPVVLAAGSEFLEAMKAATPTIYQMPAENDFKEVRTTTHKNGEWMTREKIAIKDCTVIPVDGIEDAMRHGVQVLVINPEAPEDHILMCIRQTIQRTINMIAHKYPDRPQDDPETQSVVQQMYEKLYRDLIKYGYVTHENKKRDICAYEFGTHIDPPDSEPKTFAESMGMAQRGVVGRIF